MQFIASVVEYTMLKIYMIMSGCVAHSVVVIFVGLQLTLKSEADGGQERYACSSRGGCGAMVSAADNHPNRHRKNSVLMRGLY